MVGVCEPEVSEIKRTREGTGRRSRRPRARQSLLLVEQLELRLVLNASFEHVGITSLRQDPLFSVIDGQLANGTKIGVAILDTGVVGSHPGLQSNFVAYYDAVKKSAVTTIAGMSSDLDGHGTHVAGTAVASNPAYGVATRGGLIGVRVLLADGEPYPKHDPVAEGLRWVSENHQKYNIRVVNMSLGDVGTNFNSQNIWLSQQTRAAIDTLERLGITVVTASGNSWANSQQQGSAFPGNVSTITVGNTWGQSFDWRSDGGPSFAGSPGDNYFAVELVAQPDQLAGASQRSVSLPNQLMAPGSRVVSASHRGGTRDGSGTSMASPLVAGVVALMQDAAQTFGGVWLQPSKVLEILRNTADRITDSPTDGNRRIDQFTKPFLDFGLISPTDLPQLAETGGQFLRINAHNAIRAVREFVGGGSAPVAGNDLNGTAGTAVVIPNLDGTRVFSAFGSIGTDGTTPVGLNDVDLLRLNLTSTGQVSIKIQPVPGGRDFDPYLRLFNSLGQEIAVSDDASGFYPTLQSLRLVEGTYYVGVSSYDNSSYTIWSTAGRTGGQSQGDYEVIVSLDNPDPNGVIQGAVPANQWQIMDFEDTGSYWLSGIIGSDPAPFDGVSRIGIGLDDVDIFEIIAPDTGWLNIRVFADAASMSVQPFDAALRLFDTAGREVSFSDNFDAFDPYIRYPVSRGQRLFAGVSHTFNTFYDPFNPYDRPQLFGEGEYDIHHWFETGDTNGTAWASLTPGAFNTIFETIGLDGGSLVGADGRKDVDFYSYYADQAAMLDIAVAGVSGFVPSATLWKWNPSRQEIQPLAVNTGTSVTFQVEASAGEYFYVSVTGRGNEGYLWYAPGTGPGGETGSYTVTAGMFTANSIWQIQDDSFASSAIESLPANGLRFGELGRDKTLYRGKRDVDLYSYRPQSSGRASFEAYADGPFGATAVLRLFDAAGNELAFSQDSANGRNGSSLGYDVVANRTYYVGVSGWASSGNLRAYSPTGTLSPVDGSTGGYIVSAKLTPGLQNVESVGSITLSYDGSGALLANGTALQSGGPTVNYNTMNTAGWRALAAEQINGVNTLVWQHSSGNLHFWRLSASWALVTSDGWQAPGTPDYFSTETDFGMDFDGDGVVGSRLTTLESRGAIALGYDPAGRLFAGNIGITNGGAPVNYNTMNTAGWRALAAEQINGVNTLVWQHSSGNLHFWRLSSGWGVIASDGWQAPKSAEYFASEFAFGMDFDNDGIVGSPFTLVESVGNSTLAYDSAGRLYAGSTLVTLGGASVSYHSMNAVGWQAVAAEPINGINTLVWRHSSGNLHFWRLSDSWAHVSSDGWQSPGSSEYSVTEAILGMDLNDDGVIGSAFTVVEAVGNVRLEYDDEGKLYAAGGLVTSGGAPVGYHAMNASGWLAVAAEPINGINTLVWRHSSGNLHFWRLSATWGVVFSEGWQGPRSAEYHATESAFGMDFNGDGTVGAPLITIESIGSTTLTRDSAGQLYAGSSLITLGGAAVDFNTMNAAGWRAVAAEAISGINSLVWRHVSGNLHFWRLSGTWAHVSSDGWQTPGSNDARLSELAFGMDLNGNGTVGS